MTVSPARRLKDQATALSLMASEIGDQDYQLERTFWSEDAPEFTALVSTTWDELEQQGLVHQHATFSKVRRFYLTHAGWIAGLQAAGLFNTPEQRERCILLIQYFKRQVKGRQDAATLTRTDLQHDQQPFGWLLNVVQSDLLQLLFPEQQMHVDWDEQHSVVRIPATFGMQRLVP